MRTGVSTSDLARRSASQLFKDIKDTGYESVLLSFGSITEADFEPDGVFDIPEKVPERAVEAVVRASEKHGIAVGAVSGCFNMAHPDASVREAGLGRLTGVCRAARLMGAGFVTVCSGTRAEDNMRRYSPLNSSDEAWQAAAGTLAEAARIAADEGVTLAVETDVHNVISTAEGARLIIDYTGSPNLKAALDLAGLFYPGTARRENVQNTVTHAFELIGDDVALVLGRDILEGDGIRYCGAGDGIIDFVLAAKLLRGHGFTGDVFIRGVRGESKQIDALNHWTASLNISEMF